MKKIRYFKCVTGETFDRFVPDEITITKCKCGELAMRTMSAPKVIGNTTGKSPSFSNKRF